MTEKTLAHCGFDEWFSAQIWGNEDFKTCLRMAWEDCAQAVAKAVREQCAKELRAGLNTYLDNEPSEFTNGWNSGIRYGLGRISGLDNEKVAK